MSPTAASLPTGRVGRYRCPFCEHVEAREEAMIAHRAEGECREKRDTVRVGALGIVGGLTDD